jgi:hypothetical protein
MCHVLLGGCASGRRTVASSPLTWPCTTRLTSSMLPQRAHDAVADGQAQARSGAGAALRSVAKGWNRRSRRAGEMPGPLSLRVSAAVRSSHTKTTARREPGGVFLMALCSRLRLSSRSDHRCERTGAGLRSMEKSSERSAIRAERSSATSRTTSAQSVRGVVWSGCSCSTLARASIWLASSLARSTVWPISSKACWGAMSPRRADCTCTLSTASGVRSWCEVSRTKRFWCSSRWARRCMCWLVASSSGSSSRGASRGGQGERSLSCARPGRG